LGDRKDIWPIENPFHRGSLLEKNGRKGPKGIQMTQFHTTVVTDIFQPLTERA